jgi:hypothetical protein
MANDRGLRSLAVAHIRRFYFDRSQFCPGQRRSATGTRSKLWPLYNRDPYAAHRLHCSGRQPLNARNPLILLAPKGRSSESGADSEGRLDARAARRLISDLGQVIES